MQVLKKIKKQLIILKKQFRLNDCIKPYFYLGAIFQELKNYQEAINYYEKAIKIQPNIDAYNNLGVVFKEIKEFQRAIMVLKTSNQNRSK